MLQQRLFNAILSQHETQAEALKSVGAILNLSRSNAYRRVNGGIVLKPMEITILARHYQISLDGLTKEKGNQYPMDFQQFSFKKEHVDLSKINHTNKLLKKIIQVKDVQILVKGVALPYHYMAYCPEIFYFKNQQWSRMQLESKTPIPIDFSILSPTYRATVKGHFEYYKRIKTIEIWDKNMLSMLLEQMQYSHEVGQLDNKNLKILFQCLYDLLDDLYTMTKRGSKIEGVSDNLEVYLNQIPNIANYRIVQSKTRSPLNFFSVSYCAPSVAFCNDTVFHSHLVQVFNRHRSQSRQISKVDEITRRKFFAYLRHKVQRLERSLLPISVSV